MQYGICSLSSISLRLEPSSLSELVSQILYGEVFKILEERKQWSKIRLAFDSCEGWVNNEQLIHIEKEAYDDLAKAPTIVTTDLVEFVEDASRQLYPITMGATLNGLALLSHTYQGTKITGIQPKAALIPTALLFLNTPYLWGGKTPFGIDCSGFTQMVYKLNGHNLLRNAAMQAGQGEALSFIEESEPGDLAFFDNSEGEIIHVGIIMKDHYIIHAHGKVRIDRLDHSGIYNAEKNRHTHKLRVIKKII